MYTFSIAYGYANVPKTEEQLKESHHHFVDQIVFGGDKSEFHEIIDSEIKVPKSGTKRYLKGIGRGRNIKYISYFYVLLDEYRKVNPHLIFVLDWKAAISDLKWHLEGALSGTEYSPVLPETEKYPDGASILYGMGVNDKICASKVIQDYCLALAEYDLHLKILESYGDEYVMYLQKGGNTNSVLTNTALFFNSIHWG